MEEKSFQLILIPFEGIPTFIKIIFLYLILKENGTDKKEQKCKMKVSPPRELRCLIFLIFFSPDAPVRRRRVSEVAEAPEVRVQKFCLREVAKDSCTGLQGLKSGDSL